jgi:hypothetical protein
MGIANKTIAGRQKIVDGFVVKVKEDDVDRSMDVWAATTSGEKHQSSNLPLLRTLGENQKAGRTQKR